MIPDDLLGTSERVEATEVYPNGFRLNDKVVRYSHAFKGSPWPTIQISVSQSTGLKFVRWEVIGLSADAPDHGDISGLMIREQGALPDDPPGWWQPRSSAGA